MMTHLIKRQSGDEEREALTFESTHSISSAQSAAEFSVEDMLTIGVTPSAVAMSIASKIPHPDSSDFPDTCCWLGRKGTGPRQSCRCEWDVGVRERRNHNKCEDAANHHCAGIEKRETRSIITAPLPHLLLPPSMRSPGWSCRLHAARGCPCPSAWQHQWPARGAARHPHPPPRPKDPAAAP